MNEVEKEIAKQADKSDNKKLNTVRKYAGRSGWVVLAWLVLSTAYSGWKAGAEKCATDTALDQVLEGDWFCSEEAKEDGK